MSERLGKERGVRTSDPVPHFSLHPRHHHTDTRLCLPSVNDKVIFSHVSPSISQYSDRTLRQCWERRDIPAGYIFELSVVRSEDPPLCLSSSRHVRDHTPRVTHSSCKDRSARSKVLVETPCSRCSVRLSTVSLSFIPCIFISRDSMIIAWICRSAGFRVVTRNI